MAYIRLMVEHVFLRVDSSIARRHLQDQIIKHPSPYKSGSTSVPNPHFEDDCEKWHATNITFLEQMFSSEKIVNGYKERVRQAQRGDKLDSSTVAEGVHFISELVDTLSLYPQLPTEAPATSTAAGSRPNTSSAVDSDTNNPKWEYYSAYVDDPNFSRPGAPELDATITRLTSLGGELITVVPVVWRTEERRGMPVTSVEKYRLFFRKRVD
jgi:hypothetical protein